MAKKVSHFFAFLFKSVYSVAISVFASFYINRCDKSAISGGVKC